MSERPAGKARKPKQSASMKELEEALTRALHAHPECKGVRIKEITLLADPGGPANWDAEFGTDQASGMSGEQRRVVLAAKLGVQKRLDLIERG